MKFIPESCWEFLRKYKSYAEKKATPPDYEKQSAKFNQGVETYEYYCKKLTAMKQGT
jgi:hypothetical protein